MPEKFASDFAACLREFSLKPKSSATAIRGKKPVALLSAKPSKIIRIENPDAVFSFDFDVDYNPSFPVAVENFREKAGKLLQAYRRRTALSDVQKELAVKEQLFLEATNVPSFVLDERPGRLSLKVTAQHRVVAEKLHSILSGWV